MRRATHVIFVLALAVGVLPAGATHADSGAGNAGWTEKTPDRCVPGQAYVKLHRVAASQDHAEGHTRLDGVPLDEILAKIGQRTGFALRVLRPMHFGWILFELSDAGGDLISDERDTLDAIQRLRSDPEVAKVSAEFWLRPHLQPTDPFLHYQWGLEAIEAGTGWDVTTGALDQRIGVIDTGTYVDHEDLAAKDLAGWDFVDGDADYGHSDNELVCDNGEPADSAHGSRVAGVILASSNNGRGMAGLNWSAGLVTARGLTSCGGVSGSVTNAMFWMAGYRVEGVPDLDQPVSVINLSLGAPADEGDDNGCPDVLEDYVDALYNRHGIIVVSSTGNEGNEQRVQTPANCPNVISVAAFGPGADRPLASYANFGDGSDVDIVAPGGEHLVNGDEAGVLSACRGGTDCYEFVQGTSLAAPFVTGAVSLFQALKPDWTKEQIVDIFQATGRSCEGCGSAKALDLGAALTAAVGEPTTPWTDPDLSCPGDPCSPTGTCKGDARCMINGDGDACCFPVCDPTSGGDDCPVGMRCVPTQDAGICALAGTAGPGESCEGNALDCNVESLCITMSGAKICARLCDIEGPRLCRDIEQQCLAAGDYAVCVVPLSPELQQAPVFCDLRRGNWDCDEEWACKVMSEGSDQGMCVHGGAGKFNPGSACGSVDDCASGLCISGLCTVPCDQEGSCPETFECDPEAAPGGICMPIACSTSDDCLPGWSCVSSNSGDRVCVIGGCGCSGTMTSPAILFSGLVLLGMLALGRRRPRVQ